jgi:hypothetical protein
LIDHQNEVDEFNVGESLIDVNLYSAAVFIGLSSIQVHALQFIPSMFHSVCLACFKYECPFFSKLSRGWGALAYHFRASPAGAIGFPNNTQETGGIEAWLRLGRNVALHYRSSTLYNIHQYIRAHSFSETTMRRNPI